jgi:hypothetical protein
MINLSKKKYFKWYVIGISFIALIGIVSFMNTKAVASPTNKTPVAAKDEPIIESQEDVETISTETVISKDQLSKLNFILPKNWSIDKSSNLEYGIIDENGKSVGTIDGSAYEEGFDLAKQQPNHSEVRKDEYIDTPLLGKIRLLTLDSDNGTAASGIVGTHDAYFAGIAVKEKGIFIFNFTRNDKDPLTKALFIQILKGISIK